MTTMFSRAGQRLTDAAALAAPAARLSGRGLHRAALQMCQTDASFAGAAVDLFYRHQALKG